MVQVERDFSAIVEIQQIIARIAYVSDCLPLDNLRSVFAEDIVWEFQNLSKAEGMEQVIAASQGRRDKGLTGPESNTCHAVATPLVELDGDRATAQSVYQFITQVNKVPVVRAAGRYIDSFVRDGASWKLARRIVTIPDLTAS